MIKFPHLAVATVLILTAATAFASRKASATGQQPETKPTATAAGSSTMPTLPKDAPYDLRFIDTMSKHHRAAVEMATMAHMKLQHAGLFHTHGGEHKH